MNKILEELNVSVQVYPTASASISGSATVDMKDYTKLSARLLAHKLPDEKGEGTITLSLYESSTSSVGALGSVVASSVVTGSITSASDVALEVELDAKDLSINDSKRYVYAYVSSSTVTDVAVTIDRAGATHEPV